MEIFFLGTGAAEGWPGVFCQCRYCMLARKLGGKNIRTRSSIMYNNELKVDFPPDTYLHVLKYGLDLGSLKYLLITHTHQDHFYINELLTRRRPYAHLNINYPLKIYGNINVFKVILNRFDKKSDKNIVEPHLLEEWNTYKIGKYEVIPLLADHSPEEKCYIYLIMDKNKTILHGYDTGWFPKETWRKLENYNLDLVILDCTNGGINSVKYHMGVNGVIKVREEMISKKIADKDTIFIATHFSHNGGLLHQQLEEKLSKYNIIVAYDGLKIKI